jgi:hypothetical protein
MYERLVNRIRCIPHIDRVPLIWSKIHIKLWQIIYSIIIPIQEGRSDQIFSACCDVYGVTVALSLRKASEIRVRRYRGWVSLNSRDTLLLIPVSTKGASETYVMRTSVYIESSCAPQAMLMKPGTTDKKE